MSIITADNRPGLQHLNGHLLCALDVETTGLEPGFHEIFDLAIVPLNDKFKPDRRFKPLSLTLQPIHEDRIDWDAASRCGNVRALKQAIVEGITYTAAITIINRWFQGLNLLNKKIAPLTQNGMFDLPHIRAYLGPLTYESMFQWSETRDTMYLARSLNDLADTKGWEYPFPKVDLKFMCHCMGIDNTQYGKTHTAFVDALLTADVYAAQLEWVKKRSII